MEFKTITYQRPTVFKVNADAASELRRQGMSLATIRETLGTDASLATISRAIKRAEEKSDAV